MNYSKLTFIQSLVLMGSMTLGTANAADTVLETKKSALEQVTQQIERLQKFIGQNVKQHSDIEDQLKTIELQLAALATQMNTINQQADSVQQQIDGLHAKQQTLLSSLVKQREYLARQMLSNTSLGQYQAVKIVLNQDNPATISRYLTYYRYLNADRMQHIQAMKQTMEQFNSNLNAIQQQETELKKVLADKQAQIDLQKKAQEERQALLAKLDDDTETKQQRVITLLENQRVLQDVIAKLQPQEVFVSTKPFDQLHGQLRWPTNGSIVATYGSMLDIGQPIHGVVFKSRTDEPVRAIYSGRVVFANWLRGFGLLIIIDHGNGFMSLYGRNHTIASNIGDKVKTGDVIAMTGNTGGYQDSGLYFEIRQNGTPVNPNIWCR